jgi:hypothetical protein
LSCHKHAKISFDISSLDKIFLKPEKVLKDVEGFWKKERAYQLALGWAPPGYPIHFGGFRKEIEKLAKQPLEERKQNEFYCFAKDVVQSIDRIRGEGMLHVCSYLPEDTKIDSTIYIAGYIYLGKDEPQFSPTAFIYDGNTCLNATSTHWKFNVDNVVHLMLHEIYHVGYSSHQPTIPLEEEMTTQKILDHICWQLHNEGLATYISYKSLSPFPGEEKDYDLLGKQGEVVRLLGNVKHLIEDVKNKPANEVQDSVIQIGITERAFYVAGAHMARTIEENLGKEAIVKSVKEGSRHFIEIYNSIAKPDHTIEI